MKRRDCDTNPQSLNIPNLSGRESGSTAIEESLPKKTMEEGDTNGNEHVKSSPIQRVSNMKSSGDAKVCDSKEQACVPKIPRKVRKLENGDINRNAMKMRIVQMRITQEGKEHLAHHQQGVLCKSALQNRDGKPTSCKESR